MKKKKIVSLLTVGGLSLVLLLQCTPKDSNNERPEPLQIAQDMTLKQGERELKPIFSMTDAPSSNLATVSARARSTTLSPKDVDATLNELVEFAEAFPEDMSEQDMLRVYYRAEAMKNYAVKQNVQPLHELSNWITTYIKGEIKGELEMEPALFIAHRESLINKAQTKWASIYQA